MAAPIPADLVDVHRRYNRNSAALWEPFANHRTRVTALARAPGGQRLAVLGAGNCNPPDLAALAEVSPETPLAALDTEALGRARDRQPAAVADHLRLAAPVDLSGALGQLKAFARQP